MDLITPTYIAADLTAFVVLVGILYTSRHSRKDLMAVYISINVGVLIVILLLSTMSVAAGLDLGLLSVLSTIRLRFAELTQHKVAYFFVTLVLGLSGGIRATPVGMVAVLMDIVVVALQTGGRLTPMCRSRRQMIILDYAITSETTLITHLECTPGGQANSVEVQRLDLVGNTTTVDIHFRVPRHTPAELETATAFDDIAPATQSAAESTGAIVHGTQTAQPWSGTCPNIVQAGSRPEFIEAQPLTTAPVAQYVTRSSGQVASPVAVASR